MDNHLAQGSKATQGAWVAESGRQRGDHPAEGSAEAGEDDVIGGPR